MHSYNIGNITARMQRGEVLFIQRGNQSQPGMRAIALDGRFTLDINVFRPYRCMFFLNELG